MGNLKKDNNMETIETRWVEERETARKKRMGALFFVYVLLPLCMYIKRKLRN